MHYSGKKSRISLSKRYARSVNDLEIYIPRGFPPLFLHVCSTMHKSLASRKLGVKLRGNWKVFIHKTMDWSTKMVCIDIIFNYSRIFIELYFKTFCFFFKIVKIPFSDTAWKPRRLNPLENSVEYTLQALKSQTGLLSLISQTLPKLT